MIGTRRRPADQKRPTRGKNGRALFSFVEAKTGVRNIGANSSTDPTTPREYVLSRCNHRIELVIDTRLLKYGSTHAHCSAVQRST